MSFLIEALTLGFLYGIGPCAVFCAPILIPLIMSTSKNGKDGIIQTLFLISGKTLSYVSLGMISGYAGYLFGGFMSEDLIGVFVVALGVYTFLRKYPKKCPIFLMKIGGKHLSLLLGIVIGLRPCPALLTVLSLAVLTRSAVAGVLMGLVFGLGTLLSPLVILGFLAGKWVKFSEKIREINVTLSSLFLLFLGFWKILA